MSNFDTIGQNRKSPETAPILEAANDEAFRNFVTFIKTSGVKIDSNYEINWQEFTHILKWNAAHIDSFRTNPDIYKLIGILEECTKWGIPLSDEKIRPGTKSSLAMARDRIGKRLIEDGFYNRTGSESNLGFLRELKKTTGFNKNIDRITTEIEYEVENSIRIIGLTAAGFVKFFQDLTK